MGWHNGVESWWSSQKFVLERSATWVRSAAVLLPAQLSCKNIISNWCQCWIASVISGLCVCVKGSLKQWKFCVHRCWRSSDGVSVFLVHLWHCLCSHTCLYSSNMSDALANAVCERCQTRFDPAERIVNSNGELYHENCFVCAQCFRQFPDGLFYEVRLHTVYERKEISSLKGKELGENYDRNRNFHLSCMFNF